MTEERIVRICKTCGWPLYEDQKRFWKLMDLFDKDWERFLLVIHAGIAHNKTLKQIVDEL